MVDILKTKSKTNKKKVYKAQNFIKLAESRAKLSVIK